MLTELDMQFIEVASRFLEGLRRHRELAAVLLGRLLERNGCKSVDEIVQAAWDAAGNPFVADPFVVNGHATKYAEFATAFFRAVAIEAMGGAKVSESFAEFTLPNDPCRRCQAPHPGTTDLASKWCATCGFDGTFSVPSIEQEAQS